MLNRVLAFDIETVPDIEAGARLHGLDGLAADEAARAMFHLRRQETGGSEFLPLYLHKVAVISIAMRTRDGLKLWSLDGSTASEAEVLSRFFEGIEKYTPDLVSWNGSGFDLPVLHYRSLLHGLSAPRYWETGDNETAFRYNNYLGRFHWRHIDLMDVLAGYQFRGAAPLDQLAQMCGLPGKLGMHGSKVWDAWQAGEVAAVRNYCETDTLNTYLLYVRFELLRGRLTREEFQAECALVRKTLSDAGQPHLQEFLAAWQAEGWDA